MRKIFVLIIFLFYFFIFSKEARAQVVINEISPSSDTEWVELYNKGGAPQSLQGFSIFFGDSPTTTQKYQFCNDDQISGAGYKLISLTAHYLNNSGDTVILKNTDGVVDSTSYGTGKIVGVPSSTQSITRQPDGGDNWVITDTPFPLGDVASFNCPTSTPTPTPTSTPTPTPTLSPSPTPTVIPLPTKTPSPTFLKVQNPSPTNSSSQVLAAREELKPSVSLSEKPGITKTQTKFPIIAGILIVGGIVFVGLAIFPFLRERLKAYNLIHGSKNREENIS